MNTPKLCPALLLDSPEERVICFLAPHIPGAWGLVCRRCWEIMLRREGDRRAIAQEWEEDK